MVWIVEVTVTSWWNFLKFSSCSWPLRITFKKFVSKSLRLISHITFKILIFWMIFGILNPIHKLFLNSLITFQNSRGSLGIAFPFGLLKLISILESLSNKSILFIKEFLFPLKYMNFISDSFKFWKLR